MAANKPKLNRAGDKKAVSTYDICQTPPVALEPLLPLLKAKQRAYPNMVIWESAKGPEELLVTTLRNHGFRTFGTDLSDGDEYNFFTYPLQNRALAFNWYVVQVTNPPFSIKYEWLQHSFELGIPFALLAPYETTFAAKFTKQAYLYHNSPWPIQILKPTRRINFKMPNKGFVGSSAQMPTAWITWGLQAEQQYTPYMETYEVPMRNAKYNDDNEEIA